MHYYVVHCFIVNQEETQLYHTARSPWSYVSSSSSQYRGSTLQNGPCNTGREWDSFFCILFLTVNTPHFWTATSGPLDSFSESLTPPPLPHHHPVLCISSKSGSSREKMKSRTYSWSVWLCMGNQRVGADTPGEAAGQLQEAGTMQIQADMVGHRNKPVNQSLRKSCDN